MRPAPPTPPDPGPCRSLLRAPDWVWRLLWPPNPSPTPRASQRSSPAVGSVCGGALLLNPGPCPNTSGHTCGTPLGWVLQWAFWTGPLPATSDLPRQLLSCWVLGGRFCMQQSPRKTWPERVAHARRWHPRRHRLADHAPPAHNEALGISCTHSRHRTFLTAPVSGLEVARVELPQSEGWDHPQMRSRA